MAFKIYLCGERAKLGYGLKSAFVRDVPFTVIALGFATINNHRERQFWYSTYGGGDDWIQNKTKSRLIVIIS